MDTLTETLTIVGVRYIIYYSSTRVTVYKELEAMAPVFSLAEAHDLIQGDIFLRIKNLNSEAHDISDQFREASKDWL